MKKLTAALAALIVTASLAMAGTIDLQTRFGDNTKQIVKTLSKTITYTGTGFDLRSVNVTDTESTNSISSAIGDAGVAYILNAGSGTVNAGLATGDFFAELRAGEYAVVPLKTNAATLFFQSAAGETNRVEYLITER